MLASNGINITSSQAEQYFHPTIATLQKILSELSSPGRYTVEQNLATALAAAAKAAEEAGVKNLSGKGSYPQAHCARSRG
jgi:hypothetical protein